MNVILKKIKICELIKGGCVVLDGQIQVEDTLISTNNILLWNKSHELSNASKMLLERNV